MRERETEREREREEEEEAQFVYAVSRMVGRGLLSKLYDTHVPLSGLQKAALAVGSAVGALSR